jgi:hypothetical protein
MTRVERTRGERIVAVAHSILVIAHALVGTMIVALTAPGSRAASARTLMARPLCDLEGPRRNPGRDGLPISPD